MSDQLSQQQKMDELAVKAVRVFSIDAVQKAASGHPGMPLGAAPMGYTLFSKHLKHNPADPDWANRDRFILSAGHGSMLLYSLLYLFNYGLTADDLSNFRRWGSRTPGHPEYGHTPGVEATTGPLGQGIALAVGLALAEKNLAARYNRDGYDIVDHYTYALAGDGCMMEGISSEAASLAGTWGLGKLIVLYDNNEITIDGRTDIAFTEDVAARFTAQGWQVLHVKDGNDLTAISEALTEAKAESQKPSLIMVDTVIGYGSPKADDSSSHGAPLGEENVRLTKEKLGWTETEMFAVPADLAAYLNEKTESFKAAQVAWEKQYKAWQQAYPDLAADYKKIMSGQPVDLTVEESFWQFEDQALATRAASGLCLNRLAEFNQALIGGSADLAGSNNSTREQDGFYSVANPAGTNIHFGIREFAMAAICNGLALHGLKPYGATFLMFADYMKNAIRMAALMGLPVFYIFTHDSIAFGEDGPTHQPIEQVAMLRAIPRLTLWRPADIHETAAAYAYLNQAKEPVALILSRQALPCLKATGDGKKALKGAYVAYEPADGKFDRLVIATGSELHLALAAAQNLAAAGIGVRVISMPSMELFKKQDQAYRNSILPPQVEKRLALEAGLPTDWYQFVGCTGTVLGVEDYALSAPGDEILERYGFTVDHIQKLIAEL